MGNIPAILQQRKAEKYFRSKPVYDQPATKVDRENGVIFGVQIIREGEAKGHGVHIDHEFVSKIVEFGNKPGHGIKSRFNHPNMSAGALGTKVGNFRNFRADGTAAYADLHLSESSKKSPEGNLYEYVLSLAENDSEDFGNSIAFSDDGHLYVKDQDGEKKRLHFQEKGWGEYEIKVESDEGLDDYDPDKYSEELYVIPTHLHASDLVDDPAATDGLFSAQVNPKAFAVQITTFLDTNPEIWDFVEKHPDKLQPFLEKYRAYCERKGQPSSNKKLSKPTMKKPKLFQRLFAAFKSGGTFDITVTDTDGNQLSIVTDSDTPAIGDQVTVVNESGETEPAADGNYVVADGELEGQNITVAEGQIADITDPASEEEDQQSADVPPQEVSMSALQQRITQLEAENTELKKRPAATHTEVDDEEDFTRTSGSKKEYSFNEAGLKAHEQGKKIGPVTPLK